MFLIVKNCCGVPSYFQCMTTHIYQYQCQSEGMHRVLFGLDQVRYLPDLCESQERLTASLKQSQLRSKRCCTVPDNTVFISKGMLTAS